ncbi:hypothetical protein San01_66190 [Streptomyces angustmyceticus]|uniref:Uncharacterized protein n=1 Tax=Streptomyces angustmyceticus TaxID=285578 RepID=A0A5J4LPY6_9ACTN|nr:hypothetical protein San01_66190 [Streptomyces angustmyceticus]
MLIALVERRECNGLRGPVPGLFPAFIRSCEQGREGRTPAACGLRSGRPYSGMGAKWHQRCSKVQQRFEEELP